LEDETRSLITEHFLCGRSQTELAATLGVNQSTVQRRIEKGLSELRLRLARDDPRVTPAASGLPILLAGLREVHAPTGLQQALVKIGLSGVGGSGTAAVVAEAGSLGLKSGVRKLVVALAVVALSAVGAFTMFRYFRPAAPAAGAAGGVVVTLDELPVAVRNTVKLHAPLDSLREIERKRDLGRTVFDVDFRVGERGYELRVAEDGTLIWKKPS
jgi:hypothetical protein